MILPHDDDRLPKPSGSALERLVFCVLWTTGNDPALDGIFRIQALKPARSAGAWESFDRITKPFGAGGADDGTAFSARMAHEYGVTQAELDGAPGTADIWDEFRAFVGGGPVIAPDSEIFEAWFAHLSGSSSCTPLAIGLSEIAALFFPGRLALRRSELVPLLASATSAYGPLELRAALLELAQRFHAQAEGVVRVAASGYTRAWRSLAGDDERAAARLQLALGLFDRPSAWTRADELLAEALEDGRLVRFSRDEVPLEDLLETLQPRAAHEGARWAACESLPPDSDEPMPFDAADLARLDDVFQLHLPASFAQETGRPAPVAKDSYRATQHHVAREVASTLGAHELLLVHAPTGTGKTLAYLVPAMLWARRHGVRVGVATYTRALQEQAMDREVPRALAALARAGVEPGIRVSVLKGRENYVCWRALKLALPDEEDAASWLCWTALALFALGDLDGDLDRLPLRPPLLLASSAPFVKTLQALVRSVRAQTACCSHKDDREACAAEIARRRAERSHVVITNQAFALARQEFLKHIVFDECEHLHEQAHSAWSKSVGFRSIRALLARLRQPERSQSRAILDRLERAFVGGTPSAESLARAVEAWSLFRAAVDNLESAALAFEGWRENERRNRADREEHSLLREFVLDHDSRELVESRSAVADLGNALDSALAELLERIDGMPLRSIGRVRRGFDLARTDLAEMLSVVEAWIPMDEGRPTFRPRTFYDLDRDARGDLVMTSEVLLPNEFLGRNYYPTLATGVFLSATTWLQSSFEPARAYLGLDRAAQPAEDEDRPPCVVRTFRAPDVFDWSRVLVAIPRDAPSVSTDKEAFLDYVRRFVGYLGERTRGRMLVLFTNSNDAKRIGEELTGFFRARRIPLWFQNMDGSVKEELSELFRSTVDSVLLGVDTFWYGADFPGETLEYLVIVKLPYGVPDRYHHAQCAAIGMGEQRRQIYLPRALSKFRQGFGRLMRRESDRGCVFVLDGRTLDPRHRFFLRELPVERAFDAGTTAQPETSGARLVRGDTDHCVQAALAHMNLLADVKRRGLDWSFHSPSKPLGDTAPDPTEAFEETRPPPPLRARRQPPPEPFDIRAGDVPY